VQHLPPPETLPSDVDPPWPISVTFIPASVFDNPALLRVNPEYLAWLLSLPLVKSERLLGGNWKIRPAAGLYFKREWCAAVVPKEPTLEEDHLAKTVAAIEKISGRRPVGTRGGHSPALLRKYGYIYKSEGSADQRPYYELDDNGDNCLVNLPFHYVIDDAMFFSFAWLGSENAAQRITDPERVFDIWWAAFWQ
jgi:hypothetical protein